MKKWKRAVAFLLTCSLMAGQLLGTCDAADGTQSLESYVDEGNFMGLEDESLSFPTQFVASDSNSIALYAADPITVMAGEELAAWVFAALAAACGINIEGNVQDLAMDYNYWLNRMQSEAEYKLTFYQGMAAGSYIIGQEAFIKSKNMWDSLVAGTYDVIGNGIAVTADMIDTVSAYFGDRAQAYTPSMVTTYPPLCYKGVYFGGGSFSGIDRTNSHFSNSISVTFPDDCVFYVISKSLIEVYNPTSVTMSFSAYRHYEYGTDIGDKVIDVSIEPGGLSSVSFQDWTDAFPFLYVSPYMTAISSSERRNQVAALYRNLASYSLVDNGVLSESVPWDAWETTATADGDVIILNPGDYGNPDDLGKDMGDAITAGILAGLLGKLGLKEKEGGGGDIPKPTESESGTDIPSSGAGEGEGDLSISDIIDSLAGFGEQVQALPGSIAQAISDVVIGTPDSSVTVDSIIVDKFPFCIPYDLISCVTVLKAEAAPPVWKVPFVIDSINFRYEITIDLTEWTMVVAVIRGFLLLMFIVGLVVLTRSLIRG